MEQCAGDLDTESELPLQRLGGWADVCLHRRADLGARGAHRGAGECEWQHLQAGACARGAGVCGAERQRADVADGYWEGAAWRWQGAVSPRATEDRDAVSAESV